MGNEEEEENVTKRYDLYRELMDIDQKKSDDLCRIYGKTGIETPLELSMTVDSEYIDEIRAIVANEPRFTVIGRVKA